MPRDKKGQSTLEYAVLLVVIVAALIIMQHYMKRGVQGKLRESSDEVGAQFSAGNTTYTVTTKQKGDMVSKETFGQDDAGGFQQGVSNYKVVSPAVVNRSASGENAEKITKKLNEEPLFNYK